MSSYEKRIFMGEKTNRRVFWRAQAENIDWFESPKTILKSDENGIERWFPDGVMNTSWLALDYHCEQGRGDNTALIYDSPVTGNKKTYTYRELRDQVAKIAGMLSAQGVEKRRPSCCLHADDPRSGNGNACLCTFGCDSLSCVWWFCA